MQLTPQATAMTTLKTNIGEFRGKKGDGVEQYLGIKYASLKDQLAAPEIFSSYGEEVVDATEFGCVDKLSPARCVCGP